MNFKKTKKTPIPSIDEVISPLKSIVEKLRGIQQAHEAEVEWNEGEIARIRALQDQNIREAERSRSLADKYEKLI